MTGILVKYRISRLPIEGAIHGCPSEKLFYNCFITALFKNCFTNFKKKHPWCIAVVFSLYSFT